MLWNYNGWKCSIPIPNVTPVSDGRLFVTGGYKAGSVMIQVTPLRLRLRCQRALACIPQGSQIHQPIYVDGCIYFNGTTNESRDGIVCLDPADDILWSTKNSPPPERGNLILADGLIYFIDGSGTLA